MTKVVVVGDNSIPTTIFSREFRQVEERGASVNYIEWKASSPEEFSSWTREVERTGPEPLDPPQELAGMIGDADILVVHWCPVPRRIIENASRLKLVATARAGLENLAVEFIRRRGIPILHAVGRNADTVADYAVGLMLAEARNIARGHEAVRSGIWRRTYSNSGFVEDMPGSTVGIVGLGQVGRQVARRLSGFSVRLLGYDPYAPEKAFADSGVERVSLEFLLANSDYVTIHVRLTQETRNLIGRKELGIMKPTAYLINTARAAIVDQDALIEALREKRIAGAALDVFEEEPIPKNSPFLALDNVTLTPHLAGRTVSGYVKGPRIISNAIYALICGEDVESGILVNPDALTDEIKRELRT